MTTRKVLMFYCGPAMVADPDYRVLNVLALEGTILARFEIEKDGAWPSALCHVEHYNITGMKELTEFIRQNKSRALYDSFKNQSDYCDNI